MVKYTEKIHGQMPTNRLSVLDYFVGLVIKRLTKLCTAPTWTASGSKFVLETKVKNSAS